MTTKVLCIAKSLPTDCRATQGKARTADEQSRIQSVAFAAYRSQFVLALLLDANPQRGCEEIQPERKIINGRYPTEPFHKFLEYCRLGWIIIWKFNQRGESS